MEIKEIEKIWKIYKKSEKSESIKLEILEMAKVNQSNMWGWIFEKDYDMRERLSLVEAECEAIKQLKEFKDFAAEKSDRYTPEEKVLIAEKMVVKTCMVLVESRDEINYGEINEKKLDIFNDILGNDISSFKEKVLAQKAYFKNLVIEQIQKNKKEIKEEATIEEIITLKSELLVLDNRAHVDIMPINAIKQAVEHYNQFGLNTYMNLPFKTGKTQLSIDNNIGYFTFEVTEKISEEKREDYLKILKKELSGQLSDGWGENLPGELVDNKELVLEFDYKNIEIISSKTKKLKI
jgi:hypothetical protein